MNGNDIRLRVVEGLKQDYGQGFVRVPPVIMTKLGLRTGDYIEIEGGRRTAGIVLPLTSSEDDRIIRIDGFMRKNADTSIGDYVSVRKAHVRDASTVVLAPVDDNILIREKQERIKNKLLNRPVTKNDVLEVSVLHSRIDKKGTDLLSRLMPSASPHSLIPLKLVVVSNEPAGITRITEETTIKVFEKRPETLKHVYSVTYDDIGGLKEEIARVREMIELPLRHPELFERLGIDPPKGVLLYGPPGTGKTLLAKAVANEANATFITILGPEIMNKFYGESEKKLRSVFKEAQEKAPSIIFIDELDSIAPKREESTGEVERRVVAQLLTLMDGMEARGKVIVIGATNRINAIDPALRRPGRFDREIEFGVPNKEGRLEILEIHSRGMPLSTDVNFDKLVNKTIGFVGADLEALVREAAMQTLRRILPEIDLDRDRVDDEILRKLIVTMTDFENALKYVRPSALREVFVEIPEVSWNDIGGLDDVKKILQEAVELPLKRPDIFEYHGIRPPKGILLFGAPGTGKTLLAKAVANESEANFISIRGPEVLSKYVGESERAIREIFRKARQSSPAVIFIDEVDSITSTRGRHQTNAVLETLVNQILTELDGLEDMAGVVVLAATNRPDMVDSALLRSGRFDRLLHVPIPNQEVRERIFEVHLKRMKIDESVNAKLLAEKTEGYTGADIENVCREAVMTAIRENIETKLVTLHHFEKALETIPPSTTPQMEEYYEKLAKQLLRKTTERMTVNNEWAI